MSQSQEAIGKRIRQVREALGLTQAEFGEILKIEDKSTISKYEKGLMPVAKKAEVELFSTLGLSREWLYSGIGELNLLPVKKGKYKEVIALGRQVPLRLRPDEYSEAFGDWSGLPMYNVPVTASFVESYRDEAQFQPQYYLHDPRFRDCDFGVVITGDSMHSEIRHGDFIACKEIIDHSFLVYGDIYYVVATNGLETCKYVNADPDDRHNILLVPRNEKLSPSPLPRRMIKRIYKVRGIVRGY